MAAIRHFWNYFIALENDLINISRYIELAEDNFSTYSIELEKLLFSACSEFEVISKELALLMTGNKPDNIEKIHSFLAKHLHDIFSLVVRIDRYGIKLQPFEDWSKNEAYTPLPWWTSYNKVKHQRTEHYSKANLNNVLNSLAALLIINFHYYQVLISQEDGKTFPDLTAMEIITKSLRPKTQLIEVDSKLYYETPYFSPY